MKHFFQFDYTRPSCFDVLHAKSWPSIYKVSDKPFFMQSLKRWLKAHPEVVVYTLDGSKMQKKEEYESNLIKTFNLPDYYGENLNALSECLTDEGVMGEDDRSILVIVKNPSKVLSKLSSDAQDGFFDTLEFAGMDWCEVRPMYGGGPNRPTRPFHTLLLSNDLSNFNCDDAPVAFVSDIRIPGLANICPDGTVGQYGAIVCCFDTKTKNGCDSAVACQNVLDVWHVCLPEYNFCFLPPLINGKSLPVILPPLQDGINDYSFSRIIDDAGKLLPCIELINYVSSHDGLVLGGVYDVINGKMWIVSFASNFLAVTLYAEFKRNNSMSKLGS